MRRGPYIRVAGSLALSLENRPFGSCLNCFRVRGALALLSVLPSPAPSVAYYLHHHHSAHRGYSVRQASLRNFCSLLVLCCPVPLHYRNPTQHITLATSLLKPSFSISGWSVGKSAEWNIVPPLVISLPPQCPALGTKAPTSGSLSLPTAPLQVAQRLAPLCLLITP